MHQKNNYKNKFNKEHINKIKSPDVILLDQLGGYADKIANYIKNNYFNKKDQTAIANIPVCFYLYGELGSGKTTFCRSLFYSLGLLNDTIVNSPSYCYVYLYKTSIGMIAHLDLYRIENDFNFSVLGLDSFDISAYFIEWPEKLKYLDYELKPTHKIHLEFLSDMDQNLFADVQKADIKNNLDLSRVFTFEDLTN